MIDLGAYIRVNSFGQSVHSFGRMDFIGESRTLSLARPIAGSGGHWASVLDAMEDRCSEINDIWDRMNRQPVTERDFLTVAYWAYHAMPAESVPRAMFELFQRVHTRRRLDH